MFIITAKIIVPTFGFPPVNVCICNGGPDGSGGSWQMVGDSRKICFEYRSELWGIFSSRIAGEALVPLLR